MVDARSAIGSQECAPGACVEWVQQTDTKVPTRNGAKGRMLADRWF